MKPLFYLTASRVSSSTYVIADWDRCSAAMLLINVEDTTSVTAAPKHMEMFAVMLPPERFAELCFVGALDSINFITNALHLTMK